MEKEAIEEQLEKWEFMKGDRSFPSISVWYVVGMGV